MQTSNSLSIIIVNYNTYALVVDCIRSILREAISPNYEIIVVDNRSFDRRIETITALSSKIRLIQSKENLGFGRANNLGMSSASGNYFLLLNSDTIIIENVLDKSLNWLVRHNQFGALGINQINEDRQPIIDDASYLKTFNIRSYILESPLALHINRGDKRTEYVKSPMEVNQLSGAFILLKKEVFDTTKGFDPDFFMYYEETEWCQRIRKKYKIAYHPNLSFIHLHGKSAAREVMTKQMHLSAGLFWYKKGKLAYFAFLLVSYFIYFPTWFVIALLSAKRKAHFKKYTSIYKQLLCYFIKEIPTSKNGYGERSSYLILKELL